MNSSGLLTLTLNLNFSASRKDIKNLVGNFGVLHVGNIHDNFRSLASLEWEEEDVTDI